MKFWKFCGICVVAAAVMAMAGGHGQAAVKSKRSKSNYEVSARSAIFSNSSKKKRYYGKNVHTKVQPASTTKVMTALLVLENLSMDQVVTIGPRPPTAQPSKIYLKPGEKFKVRDLLYALLLGSANDVSIALAEAVAGSEPKFVHMMNARARQIGAKHTRFANASGLPSKKVSQYTTAYDMYLIFRETIKNNFFRDTIKLKYKTIYSRAGRQVKLKSHNKMLFQGWNKNIYGKTGYTRAAQACFVGYLMKGNDVCIVAVFGCQRRWQDIKHIVSRYGGISL
ncbi:MAG: serine hydrolase [Candidatus Omnitrophota bacterium]|nr:serine hydrolase [Candidatus Omnitrophota bacterium]MDZ4242043.1 serine hydrolase [Candidatus Omnitrophota bacterium]